MAKLYRKTENPRLLSSAVLNEVVELHQQSFRLSAEEIIACLLLRDEVDLYYCKNTNKLVGTVGIQWYKVSLSIVMYIGNAVVDKDYQKYGLLTSSINKAIFKTIFYHPFSPKYNISMATSPKAYSTIGSLKYAWPKPFEKTPEKIANLIHAFLRQELEEGEIPNNIHVISPRNKNLKSTNEVTEYNRLNDVWFSLSNENYLEGDQLLCVAKINTNTVYTMIKRGLPLYTIKKKLNSLKNIIYSYLDIKDALYVVLLCSVSLLAISDFI